VNEIRQKLAKYNTLNPKKTGLVVLAIYMVLSCCLICFHEPWYDEAQAWMIAREASYSDILFFLPHYESHPPLWHLILSIPAKLGMPYEISLKTINLIFMFLAVALIEFKSPFSNWIKTFLPFTFFIFYQFGIISRPYSMMTLAMVLCALTFKKRDEKPIRFILSLAFLCLTSDYGIAIAGGMTLAWLFDIFLREKKNFLREIFSGNFPRLTGLICLLILAILLALEVAPSSDTTVILESSVLYKFYMVFLVAPAEAVVTNCLSGENLGATVSSPLGVVLTAVASLLIWAILVLFCRRAKMLHFLVFPVVCFAAIGAFYSTPHHYGIYVLIFVFVYWIVKENESDVSAKISIDKKFSNVAKIFAGVCFAVSLYWSLMASLNEIVYPFYYSRTLAEWVEENTKESDVLMVNWYPTYAKDEDGNDIFSEPTGVNYKSVAEFSVPVDPYFSSPVFANEVLPYQWLGTLDEDFKSDYVERVLSYGAPDYIFTYNENYIPGFLIAIGVDDEYELMTGFNNYRIFKSNLYPYSVMIFQKVAEEGI